MHKPTQAQQHLAVSSLALALVFSYWPQTGHGTTNEQKGLDIATAVESRDDGFTDSIVDLEMVLSNAAGETATRQLTIYTLEIADDGDKSIAYFKSPRDVKGTALLTWSHIASDDDQWLFLPSLSRVKRISSKNKSGSFVGSEFSYEDLSSQEVEKFNYKYLRDDVLDGTSVYVIERIPQYRNSGYTKQISWIDQSNHNILQTDYYDRSERLLKTLTQTDHREYQKGYWRPHQMKMINHQTKKHTTLKWHDYRFGNDLSASSFTKNRLKSLR